MVIRMGSQECPTGEKGNLGSRIININKIKVQTNKGVRHDIDLGQYHKRGKEV